MGAEWKQFAISYLQIHDDEYLAMVGSFGALMNGTGRFMWGFIYDHMQTTVKAPFRIVMGVMASIVAVAIATLPLLDVIFVDSRIPFVIWVCFIWGCVGCQYAFLPDKINTTFGSKHTGSILGLFIWIESPLALVVVVLTEFYNQIFGGWAGYCVFIAVCGMGSVSLSFFCKSDIDRKKMFKSYGSCGAMTEMIKNRDVPISINDH